MRVQVVIEGTNFTTRTGPEGGWHLVGVPAGPVTIRYDGGVLEDGTALPFAYRQNGTNSARKSSATRYSSAFVE